MDMLNDMWKIREESLIEEYYSRTKSLPMIIQNLRCYTGFLIVTEHYVLVVYNKKQADIYCFAGHNLYISGHSGH